MNQLGGKIVFILFVAMLWAACAKETSYESGSNINGTSVGTLKDSLGNCQNIIIKGNYKVDTALTDSNYVLVQVNVTTPGKYKIFTDTINGFWFFDSGYTTAGTQLIRLKGYGKPLLPLVANFVVSYNNSFCTFSISTTTVSTLVYRDYFPTTIGSNWAYDVTGLPDTLHIDATSNNQTFGGNVFRTFLAYQSSPTVPDDTSYFRKSGGSYYQYNAPDPFGSNYMEYIILKDDQPVGAQWDSPTVPTSFPGATDFRLHFTILAKNTSLTVNNINFDSVIRVQYNYQYKVLGSFQNIGSPGDSYFAKNVGLIKVEEPGTYLQTIRRWKVY
jgi:hypothetical protein